MTTRSLFLTSLASRAQTGCIYSLQDPLCSSHMILHVYRPVGGAFLFPAATYTSISWLLPGIVGGQARACDHADQRGGSESRHLCRHFSATTSPTYRSRCEGFFVTRIFP